MGTIPQWICAIALMLVVLILSTHWSGVSAEWVTAIATGALAISAIIGLGGVLVPLQLERNRLRTTHLDRLVAVVLQPIRKELQDQYEPVVVRRYTPLSWEPVRGIHEYDRRPASFPIFTEQDEPEALDEADLFNTIYADIKENHYPILIADYEYFLRSYKNLVATAIEEAERIKALLHERCKLNNLDIGDSNANGIRFGALALYIHNRLWLKNYPYQLSLRIVGAAGNNLAQLFCENTSNHYGNGTKEELEKVNAIVEDLICAHSALKSINTADQLAPKLSALDIAIAHIRINGSLDGECAATKTKGLLT